jgi:hypothetical protein
LGERAGFVHLCRAGLGKGWGRAEPRLGLPFVRSNQGGAGDLHAFLYALKNMLEHMGA